MAPAMTATARKEKRQGEKIVVEVREAKGCQLACDEGLVAIALDWHQGENGSSAPASPPRRSRRGSSEPKARHLALRRFDSCRHSIKCPSGCIVVNVNRFRIDENRPQMAHLDA